MAMPKKTPPGDAPAFDSIVVITLLTTDVKRRDQIDRLIDEAFAKDRGVQVVRVVGYPAPPELDSVVSTIDRATGFSGEDALGKDGSTEPPK